MELDSGCGNQAGGEQLPSENELSAKYGVSRQTVRKALEILQNKGYIYAEYGRGDVLLKTDEAPQAVRKYRGHHDISPGLYFSACHRGITGC